MQMTAGSSVLKRKIPWSDNSNDSEDGNCSDNGNLREELSRHSKVARTQLDIVRPEFAALDRESLWSDERKDSDNGNLESHERWGASTRPRRREDIVRPIFTGGSHRCCAKCESMTGTPEGLGALLSDGGYKHFNWYEIQETAAGGCAICRAIWDVTEHEDWDYEDDGSVTRAEIRILASFTRLPSPVEGRLSRHPLNNIHLHSLDVQIPLDPAPMILEWARFNLVTLEGKLTLREKTFDSNADSGIADPASGFVPGRRESKELNPKMVAEIRRWLEDCLNKHPSCPRGSTPKLPRRVLDVGADNSTIRLHESLKNEKAQYATLSYCWGSGVQQLTTTTSNLHDHMLALPRHLPKTISDAVEVCRKAGIRYLWVDAFCIIQDDSSDKSNEIAKMGSIYKNSTVAIVAASAEKVTDGFLWNGKPEEPIAQLPMFVDNSTSGTYYLRMQDSDKIYSSEEPIFQRAWTLQEILLSPRAIVFDSCQITLKCLGHGFQPVHETYIDFEFQLELPVSVFGLVDENLARIKEEETRENYLTVTQNRIWKQIICEYSKRDLTLFDDRLPALAGIATELAKSWNDVYLAGFWKKTIIQHLGWYRSTPALNFEGVHCTKRIGSPSWSWVTVPYPVSITELDRTDAKLIDSGIQLVSQKSPFGMVKGAFIALEARVLRASDLDLTLKFSDWPSRPYHDGIGLDFEYQKPELDNCRLVYLGGDEFWNMFLVVQKSEGRAFQRVGYAELSSWQKEWINLLSSTQREVIVIT